MKIKSYITAILCLAIGSFVMGQELTEEQLEIPTAFETVKGTLIHPAIKEKPPLVIIIPGSGPTDRNGNSGMTKNNSLKFLAESLSKNGIATFRYDKTVLNFTPADTLKINALTFDMFFAEAADVIEYFKKNNRYSSVIVAGHSQGSLVGMIAGLENSDAFISLAGMGRTVDVLLEEQIAKQAPVLLDETKRILKELRAGNTVDDFNPFLISLFNKTVQPFLISYMKYDPCVEISKLNQPVLIVQGTKDIQITVNDAELLKKAHENAKLVVIPDMNHLFKKIEGDANENMQSYSNPELPIMEELTNALIDFINEIH